MEMSGERHIAVPKRQAWDALFDPGVLRRCIPGCQSVEKVSDVEFKANIMLAIGPVRARFAGDATMSDIDPPHGCKLTGKGSGGVAGFGKGEAWIRLNEDGAGTLLTYQVKASVGGKLAQVGQRLIDSTAQKLSEEFFSAFVNVLEEQRGDLQTDKESALDQNGQPASAQKKQIRWILIAACCVFAIAVGYFFAFG